MADSVNRDYIEGLRRAAATVATLNISKRDKLRVINKADSIPMLFKINMRRAIFGRPPWGVM